MAGAEPFVGGNRNEGQKYFIGYLKNYYIWTIKVPPGFAFNSGGIYAFSKGLWFFSNVKSKPNP